MLGSLPDTLPEGVPPDLATILQETPSTLNLDRVGPFFVRLHELYGLYRSFAGALLKIQVASLPVQSKRSSCCKSVAGMVQPMQARQPTESKRWLTEVIILVHWHALEACPGYSNDRRGFFSTLR